MEVKGYQDHQVHLENKDNEGWQSKVVEITRKQSWLRLARDLENLENHHVVRYVHQAII